MRGIERAWGALKSMLKNRGLGTNAKKCLYEAVIVPTALYLYGCTEQRHEALYVLRERKYIFLR